MDPLLVRQGAVVAQHRRQLSRTEEVSRLAEATLLALVMAVGLWFALREVVDGNYASVVTALITALITGALGTVWTSWRRKRRSSNLKR
jgi:divalent metal cation (Fe/Co/Zn/Cd) transporter